CTATATTSDAVVVTHGAYGAQWATDRNASCWLVKRSDCQAYCSAQTQTAVSATYAQPNARHALIPVRSRTTSTAAQLHKGAMTARKLYHVWLLSAPPSTVDSRPPNNNRWPSTTRTMSARMNTFQPFAAADLEEGDCRRITTILSNPGSKERSDWPGGLRGD